jgi:ABC-type amino acid transport substrate-binding protein
VVVLALLAGACGDDGAARVINTWQDLKAGDAVAVQTGTTGEIWAKENLEPLGIVIRSFTQPADCFTALEGGQVIGTIIDIDPSLEAEATRPGLVVAQEIVTGEAYGFGVNPANAALLTGINAVFTEMLADGFYQATYDEWIERAGASVLFEASPPTTGAPVDPAGITTVEAGILKIGSDIPYPPFEDFDASGDAVGFDVDLMNEIARRLGLEPVWVDTDFDTIFTQLAQGTWDVVASATTITAEREEMVNFTIPYFNANQALTVRGGD